MSSAVALGINTSEKNTLNPEFKVFEKFEKKLGEYLKSGALSPIEQQFLPKIYHLFKKTLDRLHSVGKSSHNKYVALTPQISSSIYDELVPSSLGTAKSTTDATKFSNDSRSPLLRSKIHEAKNILAAAMGFFEFYLQEGYEQSFLESSLQAFENLSLKDLFEESPQIFSAPEIQTILSSYCETYGVSFSFDHSPNADFSWNIVKSHLDGILEEIFRNYDKYGENGLMKLSVKNGMLQIVMENTKKTISKVSYSSGQGSTIIKDFVTYNGGGSEVNETPNSYTLKIFFPPWLS